LLGLDCSIIGKIIQGEKQLYIYMLRSDIYVFSNLRTGDCPDFSWTLILRPFFGFCVCIILLICVPVQRSYLLVAMCPKFREVSCPIRPSVRVSQTMD
jgi:hypothetical protein